MLIITLFVTLGTIAQQEHLKFMGIPIDGKVWDFKRKIEKKGFEYVTQFSNGYCFKGVFTGKEARVFVLYENSTKKVYGVGVNIDCYSEKVAIDTYWRYVRNLKEKYNAQSVDNILNLYDENPEDLYSDIIMGKFKGYNTFTTDSINNSTKIDISKVIIDESDSIIAIDRFGFGMLHLYLKCTGNIGSVIVKYEKAEESYSPPYEYTLSLLYRDNQNATEALRKEQDDL